MGFHPSLTFTSEGSICNLCDVFLHLLGGRKDGGIGRTKKQWEACPETTNSPGLLPCFKGISVIFPRYQKVEAPAGSEKLLKKVLSYSIGSL